MSVTAPASIRGTGKNWTPADEEARCVRQMTAAEKLPYSLGAIVDNDGFWCAFEDDFYVVYGYKNKKLLPIWPARRFAEEALSRQSTVDIRWVSIDQFRHDIIDHEFGYVISVCPDVDGIGPILPVGDFSRHLEAELSCRGEALAQRIAASEADPAVAMGRLAMGKQPLSKIKRRDPS